MPEIMDAEAADAGSLAQPSPVGLQAGIGQRVALALLVPGPRALADKGENIFGMMPAQGPQDVRDLGCDRNGDALAALAKLDDLAALISVGQLSSPALDLAPFQEAFLQPQPGR